MIQGKHFSTMNKNKKKIYCLPVHATVKHARIWFISNRNLSYVNEMESIMVLLVLSAKENPTEGDVA